MTDLLLQPWPWYIAGPLIGLIIPLLLYFGNKAFGFSSNFRHVCAACFPSDISFFKYDWKKDGTWNLVFLVGTVVGGFVGGYLFANPDPIILTEGTKAYLTANMGVTDFSGFVPAEIFNWKILGTASGIIILAVGGFLIGFGTRYAGGCTSGHAISGLANLQIGSLIAVIGFFIGGMLMTYFILPALL
jgi:uncharacterized membrane protein YedE/YeeE